MDLTKPTTAILFDVPGVPVAQPRQRTRVVQTSDGRTFAQNYTTKRDPVNVFKAAVQLSAQAAHQGPLLTGPLAVRLTFILPRPQSMTWKTRPMPRVWAPKKPDVDNLAKAVCDALNNVLWVDDSQVVQVEIRKQYAAGDEAAKTEVMVEVLNG